MGTVDTSGLDPRALEALLSFWADAGVDAALDEAPVDRLAARPPRAAPAAERSAPSARPASASREPAGAGAADAARLASAAGDLAALRAAVEAFDGCALRATGSGRAVFAHLPERTEVVVVAEAPAPEDEAEGAPFTGPAGRLVRALLRHAGLEERAVLTQTVFWRPPGGAQPAPADQAACRPFLERLIALARPKALLVMGEGAARGLLDLRDPILKARGNWGAFTGRHEAELSVAALPTLSAAFLLARPPLRKAAWGDILSLAARVEESASDG